MSVNPRLSLEGMRENVTRKFKAKLLSRKKTGSIIKQVFNYAKPYRIYLYLAIIFDILNTITNIFIPIFTGYSINCAISQGNVDFPGLYTNLMYLIIFIIGSVIFNWLGSYSINCYNYKATYRIRDLLFKKINTLPISYIDSVSHGDLLSRMINDIDIMTDGFLESIESLITGILTVIGTVIAMLILNYKIALIIIILTPISVLLTWYIIKKSKKYFKLEVQMDGQLSGFLEEYISGERVVKAFNHEDESLNDFKKLNEEYYKVGKK